MRTEIPHILSHIKYGRLESFRCMHPYLPTPDLRWESRIPSEALPRMGTQMYQRQHSGGVTDLGPLGLPVDGMSALPLTLIALQVFLPLEEPLLRQFSIMSCGHGLTALGATSRGSWSLSETLVRDKTVGRSRTRLSCDSGWGYCDAICPVQGSSRTSTRVPHA